MEKTPQNEVARQLGVLADRIVRMKPGKVSRFDLDEIAVTLQAGEKRIIELYADWRVQQGRVRVLERAIGNCFMMAKREIARYLNGRTPPDSLTLERWQHIQRFCETTGIKSDILRGQLPDEITEGSEQDRARKIGESLGLSGNILVVPLRKQDA